MPHRFHRMVFRDLATLADVMDGRLPDRETLRRRLFISEWRADRYTPDHVQKNLLEHNIPKSGDCRDLVVGSLTALAEHYLEVRDGRPSVKREHFEDWQTLLTWLAPLPIMTTAVWRRFGAPVLSFEAVLAFVDERLAPVFARSALPTAHDPMVDTIIRRTGLKDLHIHLNGTTEVDAVWLDVLLQRRSFQAEILKAGHHGPVLEQYSQIEEGLRPDKLGQRMRIARRIRLATTDRLFGRPAPKREDGEAEFLDHLQLVARRGEDNTQLAFDNRHDLLRHPMRVEFGLGSDHSELTCEALWLTLVLQHIHRHRDEVMAWLLHTYLLILNGNFVPLCVQQEEQVGFDQFQKITLNGAREASEREYLARLRQVSYSTHGDLALLEGRIAPKADFNKMTALLRAALGGFARFQGYQPGEYDPSRGGAIELRKQRLDLRLIAHFIKEDELSKSTRTDVCRFHDLRLKLRRQLRVLVALRERYPGFRHYLTGIDAASNELHTPPEVFAPLYRAARRAGFSRFTYHVGEDFEHLISGIRAVYEAVRFLGLRSGDRIGHGTAIGIEPSLWIERSQREIAKKRGDWLDDLIFAHMVLGRSSAHAELHRRIETDIATLSQSVYGERLPPVLLEQAWRLRHLDILLNVSPAFSPLGCLDAGEIEEWDLLEQAKSTSPEAFRLLQRYHNADVVKRARKIELVAADYLPDDALVTLQLFVVEEMNKQRIAIECPPTSNLRISLYDHYGEHHLFRWLGLRRPEESKPIACLATDDPGIFSTNMRNEIVHIHRVMREDFGLSESETITLLNALDIQGDAFAFR